MFFLEIKKLFGFCCKLHKWNSYFLTFFFPDRSIMGKKTSSPKSKTSFKSAISPPIKTADDSVDPVKAAQAALTEKKRKRGPIKDLFQKVGSKVGIVEQTKIAPEFAAKLEGYAWYQKYADNLVEYIESK